LLAGAAEKADSPTPLGVFAPGLALGAGASLAFVAWTMRRDVREQPLLG